MTTSNAIPTVKLLIDGEFIESTTQEWRDVVNPATQEVRARAVCDRRGNRPRRRQRPESLQDRRKTPIGARARIFLKYQQLIRENMKELAAILTAEQGKTLADAEGDVFRGRKWSSTPPVLATCSSASWRTTSPPASIPIPCCSRWASALVLPHSTSRR